MRHRHWTLRSSFSTLLAMVLLLASGIDIGCAADPGNSQRAAAVTLAPGPTPVVTLPPLPSSAWLLCSGVLGLIAIGLRRRPGG